MATAQIGQQLTRLDRWQFGDGTRPLPRRLETLCRLTAGEELSAAATAEHCRVSERTVRRVRAHPVIKARIAHLREQVRAAALDDAPLADRRNRIVAVDRLARELIADLAANGREAIIGVSAKGQPIHGFDRGRVAEVGKLLALLDDMTEGGQERRSGTAGFGVQVTTLTMDDAVQRVQALFSRMEDAPPPYIEAGNGTSACGTILD